MKSAKKIWLIVIASILAFVLMLYTVISSLMLSIAITDEEKWDVIRDSLFTKSNSKIADMGLSDIFSGTVKLTIAKEFVAFMGEDFDYTLTQEQIDNGFTKVEKQEDGSAVYTIKKEKYDIFIKDLRQTTKESLQEVANLLSENGNTSIRKMSSSSDFERITFEVDKQQYIEGMSMDSIYVMSCGLTSCMYQMFDINSTGKCKIEIKDVDSGEIFKTIIYPDEMQED